MLSRIGFLKIRVNQHGQQNIGFINTIYQQQQQKKKNTENSHQVGLQWDGSFHSDLGECKETPRMLLVYVELGEILLFCKSEKEN